MAYKSEVFVGGRPQFLPVEALLQDCLNVSTTQRLASPRENDPKEIKASIFYDNLGSNAFLQYSVGITGES